MPVTWILGLLRRGDRMEQKMSRVIRACVEAPEGLSAASMTQGAGGNGEKGGLGQGTGPTWSLLGSI